MILVQVDKAIVMQIVIYEDYTKFQSLSSFLLNLSSDSIIENRKEQSLILFYRLFRFIYVPLLIKKVYFSYIPKYNKIFIHIPCQNSVLPYLYLCLP
jgi:hypothetical protein